MRAWDHDILQGRHIQLLEADCAGWVGVDGNGEGGGGKQSIMT